MVMVETSENVADSFNKLKYLFLMEKHRVESYSAWPFAEGTTCSITKMAEAGFHFNGNESENDTATCFICAKTLDGWEATDDPWKEHRKHAPQCLFVKYGKKEGELTLEQFLELLKVVLKNDILKKVEKKKKHIINVATTKLNTFLGE